MSSDFPLSVRSRNIVFLSQQGRRGCVFAVFFTPIPEKGISDFIEDGSIIQVITLVFQDEGFSFGSVPQTISYWGQSSVPDCSGSCSTSISHILRLFCQGAGFFAGCQLLACALNGLGPYFFGQLLAKCPGCAHLRHSCSRILLWNSSLEILNLGLFRVASSSIGSP